MPDAGLRVGLGLAWFRSVSSAYSGHTQVRSDGLQVHGRAAVSCQDVSHMLGLCPGMLTHGAMSDVSGGVTAGASVGSLVPINDIL